MKYLMFFLKMTVFAALFCGCAGNKADYDVYLLIGQSNMAGRGMMEAEDTLNVIDGVWLLDPEGKPEPATAPLNRYSTIRKEIGMQQIGPGNSFSAEMHKATGRKILLVVNARGGSSLDEWMPWNSETGYFDAAVERTRQAMRYGELKAVLWHQGESDSGRPDTYLDSLSVFVRGLRDSLDVGNVPFVAGEVGHWTANADAFNGKLSHTRRRQEYCPFGTCGLCFPEDVRIR